MNKRLLILWGMIFCLGNVSAYAEIQPSAQGWKLLASPPEMDMNKYVNDDNFALTVSQGIPYVFVSVNANASNTSDAFIQLGQWYKIDGGNWDRSNSILSMLNATDQQEELWRKKGFAPGQYISYVAGSMPYISMFNDKPYLLSGSSLYFSDKHQHWSSIDDVALNGKNSYMVYQKDPGETKKILSAVLKRNAQFDSSLSATTPGSEQLTNGMVGNIHFILSRNHYLYVLVKKKNNNSRKSYLVLYRMTSDQKKKLQQVGDKISFDAKDGLDGPYSSGIYFNMNMVCTLVGYQYQPVGLNLSSAVDWHVKRYCYDLGSIFQSSNALTVTPFKKQVPANLVSHIKLVEDQRGDHYNYQLEKYINHHWVKKGSWLKFMYVEEKYFYVDGNGDAYLLVVTQPSSGEHVLDNNRRKFYIYKFSGK